MSSIDIKFRKVRFDQSPYLFHFTSGTIKEAKEAMFSILSQKMLLSTSGVICFTASPITALLDRTGSALYVAVEIPEDYPGADGHVKGMLRPPLRDLD